MSVLKVKDPATGAWVPIMEITCDSGAAVEKVADETGSEMTEVWAEIAQLRSIVRDWPTLAERGYWLKKASENVGITISVSEVTEVHFVSSYEATGEEDESWNADVDRAGTITGYRTGTVVTLSGNGSGKIRMNPNATAMFASMTSLEKITGLELLDGSNVESLAGAFYNDKALQEIDLSGLQMPLLGAADGMCNNCTSLRTVKLPRYGIPKLAVTESMFDGCIALTEVDMGRGMPIVGKKMFFKCLELTAVSGLDSVTAIGDRAFVYAPKLAAVDLRAKNITSIGESACRLSSIEDSVPLSAVTDVGDMGTRRKRWSDEALAELRSLKIPTVFIEVPNTENDDNYADMQFGTYKGEPVSVAEAGCGAVTLYHEWNAIYAGTEKEYASFGEWWNDTIGATDFVENNTMDNSTISKMLDILGWKSLGLSFVTGAAQLQTIIDRLSAGLPTFASMNSANYTNRTHSVLIVGGDTNTGKLAVLDSHVVGTDATVSWLAFEDIFVEGRGENDYIEPFSYGEG